MATIVCVRAWAFTILEHTVAELRDEYVAAHKDDLFNLLRGCLQGDRSAPPYSELAAKLGMTESAIKVAVHRMRQRYGELLRRAVAQTVAHPGQVDEELRHLISVVGR